MLSDLVCTDEPLSGSCERCLSVLFTSSCPDWRDPEARRVNELAPTSEILNSAVSISSGLRPAYIALNEEPFAADSYREM
jgi:hypothetical protein